MLACLSGLKIEWMHIFLVIGLVLVLFTLWHVQRAVNRVDFADLLIGEDHKVSWSKMAAIAGFCIGSWIVIYMTMHDKMTEWLFLIYFAVCVGSPMAFSVINIFKGRPPPDPPQQTTTTTGPAGTVTIQAGP